MSLHYANDQAVFVSGSILAALRLSSGIVGSLLVKLSRWIKQTPPSEQSRKENSAICELISEHTGVSLEDNESCE